MGSNEKWKEVVMIEDEKVSRFASSASSLED